MVTTKERMKGNTNLIWCMGKYRNIEKQMLTVAKFQINFCLPVFAGVAVVTF
jgi:hypothetical protein